MVYLDFLALELENLKKMGWFRELHTFQDYAGPEAVVNNRKVLIFSSNNYLGLSHHPQVVQAAQEALARYGTTSTGSRLTTGNFALHEALEERLASFKGTKKALLYSSGYLANFGVISALMKRRDLILSDELNHASIKEGCRLVGSKVLEYRHTDMAHLEELLQEHRRAHQRAMIVTDSVFSMDGDVAPLKEIAAIAEEYDAILMVDEAHATGVFGKRGSGLVEALELEDKVPVRMGTLSKAIGAMGGYIAGSTDLIQWLVNRSRPFMYDTALPPAVVAASLKAVEIIEKDITLRQKLWDNIQKFKSGLKNMGINLLPSSSAICCIQVGKIETTLAFSKKLYEKGIWAPAIRPPTVKNSRIRFTLMATHTPEQIETALKAIKSTAKEMKIL